MTKSSEATDSAWSVIQTSGYTVGGCDDVFVVMCSNLNLEPLREKHFLAMNKAGRKPQSNSQNKQVSDKLNLKSVSSPQKVSSKVSIILFFFLFLLAL
jgi:hypothetical protein